MRHASTYAPVVAATSILVFVLAFVRQPGDTMLWAALFNWGHAPLFGLFAALVYHASGSMTGDRKISRPARYAATFLLTTSVGILTELLQHFTGGDAELEDLLRDVAGAVVVVTLVASFDPPLRSGGSARRWALRLFALVILAATALPAVLLGADYLRRDSAFPVVMDFTSTWRGRFFQLHGARLDLKPAPPGWPLPQQRDVALVEFRDGEYPGCIVREPYPDWSGYDRLSFTVYSGMKEPVVLVLRIDDAQHNNRYTDRFNRRVRIPPGISGISIPLSQVRDSLRGRKMDMTRIRRVVLFAMRPAEPFALQFGPLKLEK